MGANLRQAGLFDQPTQLPHGLVYQPGFITPEEEAALLDAIAPLPFREAKFREYHARRRVVHFHADQDAPSYDAGDADSFSSGPLPPFLSALKNKVAAWVDVDPESFVHALVSEYRPGSPIGWHRDKPVYGIVVGISLSGFGRMRWRPYDGRFNRKDIVTLDLEPRSAYVMRGSIRWEWQHSLLPTRMLRHSITFRTRASDGER
jgi:alkylated DNA repair dioxygenase AlkB